MRKIVDSLEMILFCEIDSPPPKKNASKTTREKHSKATKDGNSLNICALELEIITENMQ